MKKIIFVLLILSATTTGLFAQTAEKEEFLGYLDSFLEEMNAALPDNAIVGGTWSDAYIGQIVGIPPHFGVGISSGVTRFKADGLKAGLEMTGTELPYDELILPSFAAEARVGGFLIPFDAGIKVGMVPTTTLDDLTFGYLNLGADVRFALMKQGLVKPNLSLGLGVSHTAGELSYMFNPAALVGLDGTWTVDDEELKTTFSTTVYELKAQVSKSLVIITPYAGASVYTAVTKSEYDLAGETGLQEDTSFGARVFGGASFNILLLKIDVSGMYNPMTENWGANLGARIQL